MTGEFDFYNRRKEELTELEKWKKMSGTARVQYLYDNYLAQLIVGVVLLTAASIIITSVYNKSKPEAWLTIGILDYDDLRNTLEQEVKEEDRLTNIVAYQGINYESLLSGASFEPMFGLVAMITAGDVDIILASKETLQFLQKEKNDYFSDLNEIVSSEELGGMGKNVLYVADENGEDYPLAVNVADASCFQESSFYGNEIYLAVTVNTPRLEHVIEWMEEELGIWEHD